MNYLHNKFLGRQADFSLFWSNEAALQFWRLAVQNCAKFGLTVLQARALFQWGKAGFMVS